MTVGEIVKKGKCYSKVNRGQRKKSDEYLTPRCMVRALLVREPLPSDNGILEPCHTKDAVLFDDIKKGYRNVIANDMVNGGIDFLLWDNKNIVDTIITNPPYSIANEIIKKAKQIAQKKICMLLPLNYLQGQERYKTIWKDIEFPLARVYVFDRMPDLSYPLREDGKIEKTGMQSYAWYVWEKGCKNKEPVIRWINIRKQIARAHEW